MAAQRLNDVAVEPWIFSNDFLYEITDLTPFDLTASGYTKIKLEQDGTECFIRDSAWVYII